MSAIESQQRSQQRSWQGRVGDLPTLSEQQPSRSSRPRPRGIAAGIAVTSLAALSLSLVLCYAVTSAINTRDGYAGMRLRREIEDMRAEGTLIRYQTNVSQSRRRVAQAAARMGLESADAVLGVDYVMLPAPEAEVGVAREESGTRRGGLAALLTGWLGGSAEASTSTHEGHRQ